jgi:hypothetical protein
LGKSLIPKWIHPGADRKGVSDEHMQALDAIRHPTRADPTDLDNILDRLTGRQIRLMSLSVRSGKFRVFGKPILHLLHQSTALKRSDRTGQPWAGQVVERWERRTVRQARVCLDYIGIPT